MLPPSTPRLILREATEDDAGFMLRLLTEPSWKRFIRDHDIETEAAARDYLNNSIIALYGEGYGFWVVQPRDSDQPAGVCGLIKRDYLEQVDIGFGFLEQHWGKGFAKEASRAVIDYALQTLRLTTLWAVTRADNSQSIALLRTLGFEFTHELIDPNEQPVTIYELRGTSADSGGAAQHQSAE